MSSTLKSPTPSDVSRTYGTASVRPPTTVSSTLGARAGTVTPARAAAAGVSSVSEAPVSRISESGRGPFTDTRTSTALPAAEARSRSRRS